MNPSLHFKNQHRRAAILLALAAMTAQEALAADYHFRVYSAGIQASSTFTLSVTPGSLDFGQVDVGSNAQQSLIIQNTGNQHVTISSANIVSGAANYSRVNSCGTLAPAESCQVSVGFYPSTGGSLPGSLSIISNAQGSPNTIALSGTGLAGELGVSIPSYNFGTKELGSVTPVTITVSNSGTAPTSLSFSNLTAPYSRSGGSCGATLAANTTCSVVVDYAPTTAGATSQTLTISGSSGVASRSITYSGTGDVAVLTPSPSSYNFNNVNVGSSSTHTLTISNSASVGTSLSFSPLSAPYSRNGGDCSTVLAANSSCTFIVRYAPTTSDSHPMTLTISGGQGVTARTVNYSGTGASATVALVTSGQTTFLKKADGTWHATGDNSYGQLGLGSTGRLSKYTRVPALDGASQVVVTGLTTFAKLANGSWAATGYNAGGGLGIGSTSIATSFTVVPELASATAVHPGVSGYGAFAKLSNGSWVAAGSNNYGQLGVGDTANKTRFVPVTTLSDATQIVADGEYTFAKKPDGSWVATGRNLEGQLGLGDTTSRSAFSTVSALQGATTVVLGKYGNVYAKLSNGTWAATGGNNSGQLGLGDTTRRTTFTAAASLNGATQVVPGASMALAQLSNGTWTAAGELRWTSTPTRNTFTSISELTGAQQVFAGLSNTWVKRADGTWAAAGFNGNGELGLGDQIDRTTLTPLP